MTYQDLLPLAVREIKGEHSGDHALTRLMPSLLHCSDISTIDHLFSDWRANYDLWSATKIFPYSAEFMTFLSVPGIDEEMRKRWVATLTDTENIGSILGEKAEDLAYTLGKVGVFSFSFPIWRFLSQRLQNTEGKITPAILESAGMERLLRDTDTFYDDNGRKADWLGAGYLKSMHDREIEYRRAYLRITVPHEGSLLIRNSSYFFGRDRFQHPAYFSPDDVSAERLEALTPAEVDEKKILFPLTSKEVWRDSSPSRLSENASRLSRLMKVLLEHETELSNWLFDSDASSPKKSPGSDLLLDNLFERMDHVKNSANASRVNVPVLGFIDPHLPPWFPYDTLEISRDNLASLSKIISEDDTHQQPEHVLTFLHTGLSRKAKLVLLSGAGGDYPLA